MKKFQKILDTLYWEGKNYENRMQHLFSKESFKEIYETLNNEVLKECTPKERIILLGCFIAIPVLIGLAFLSRLF